MTSSNGHETLESRLVSTLEDPGFQNELAQVRSKAKLRAVGELGSPPRWTYVGNRFSRNSAAALYALEYLAINDDNLFASNQARCRQLALAWESLGDLAEGAEIPIARLYAALAYELAGFQANAAYLAKSISQGPEYGTPPASVDSLIASFIQRRLITTIDIANRLIRTSIDPDLPMDDLSLALGEIVLADGLSKACSYFLSGSDTAYSRAISLLDEAINIFDGVSAARQSNVAFGLRSVLPLMRARSTWSQLRDQASQSEVWRRYMTLLARPLRRGVTELWPSQIKALDSNLFDSDDSMILRLPTSSGKTRIAEMAIVDTLQRYSNSKCVFVAPYRALASEVEITLGSILSDLGYRVSSVVGSYEDDEFEDFLMRTADVLIVTPEKLDLLLRLRPEISQEIKLLVLDEVHVLDDEQRGIKFELLLSRLKRKLPETRFLVMSAVVPDSTLETFARWLADSHDRTANSDWRPTIQRLSRFEWRGNLGVIRFEQDSEIPDLETYVPGIIQQKEYSFIHPDTRRRRVRQFPKPEKGDTAAELAYTLSSQGPVLVFCTQPNWAESVGKGILNKSIYYREMVNEEIHPHFTREVQTRSLELAREWLGDEHIATQALSKGVALHHGRLPNIVREAIENDCRAGRYNVIVATNTLAQGVNLPVRTVVIHSTWRSDDRGERSRIPVRDYTNIAGRAGRAGMETEGLVVHITLNNQDRLDFRHYRDPDHLEPVQGALFRLLQRIVNSRLSSEAIEIAASILDPEILAIAIEEGITPDDLDSWDTALLGETFAALQEGAQEAHIQALIDSARLAATRVFQRVAEPAFREAYARTGLSSSSCEALRSFVEDYDDQMRNLLLNANYGDMERLNHFTINASLHLPEAQTTTAYSGDPEALLNEWMQGNPIGEIIESLQEGAETIERTSRYIEELFGFRLPWVASALIRIAKVQLDISDEDLSDYIGSYPSMVKHGIPEPVASWAMSAGIPSRRIALLLAQAFSQQHRQNSTHQAFVEWLSTLTDDTLRHEYGISGFVLDDLKHKLRRVVANRFLKPILPIEEVLPTRTEIAGLSFGNRSSFAQAINIGDRLELQRDYENPVDSNAISLLHGRGQVGYLPSDLAQRLAPEIDAGALISAITISELLMSGPTMRINLNLEQAAENVRDVAIR